VLTDCHCYLGPCLFGPSQDRRSLLETMDQCGVERAVVIAARPPTYRLGPANAAVLQHALRSRHRLVPLVRIDPWQGDAAIAEARSFLERGARALYLNPWEESFAINSEVVWPMAALAERADCPVFVSMGHPWVAHPTQLGDLAKRFGRVRFIASHGASLDISGRGLHDARRLLTSCPNVWIDTSGVYRMDFLEGVIRDFGARRVLFGSGSPYFDMQFELERARAATSDNQSREAVLSDNAQTLFQQ
jgi:uncharacterized protein